jgi:hypothetical protein
MRAREGFIEMNLEKIFASRSDFERPICFDNMQENATSWSGKYTLDLFEEEIKKLLQS